MPVTVKCKVWGAIYNEEVGEGGECKMQAQLCSAGCAVLAEAARD